MPVNNSEDIQSITDSNAIGDDPDKPIVYGGVIFNLPARYQKSDFFPN